MRTDFPLFHSHLDLAHQYWSQLVQEGDIIIDATCGNGYDTLKLCQLALSIDKGKVYAFDIQSQAIELTRRYIESLLPSPLQARIDLQQRCHSIFPRTIASASVKLIIYNLGYLPGGDKRCTTQVETTLQSLSQAQHVLQPGGVISITCYPGHPVGAQEQEAVLTYLKDLPPNEWSCCHQTWVNRQQAPTLLIIQKRRSIPQEHPNPTTVR